MGDFKVKLLAGGGVSGYWVSPEALARPYVIYIGGGYLRGRNGQIRRFASRDAATKAAEKYLGIGA